MIKSKTSKNNKMPYCSIIVLNYNAKKFIEKCLSSLHKLNYPKSRYQIVFVDNASIDGSVNFVKEKFPRVKIIKNKKNLGFSAGNNVALKTIKSDYYILINVDMFVDRNWLINLVKVAESDDRIGLCASKILTMSDKSKINYAGGWINFLGFAWPKGFLQKDKKEFNKIEETGYTAGGALLIKKEVLEKVGLLEENFFMYYDDIDYSWRVKLFGFKTLYVPKAVIYHNYQGSSEISQNVVKKFYHLEKNRLETLIKCYSLKTLLLLFPLTFFVELGLNFYFLIFYKNPLKLLTYEALIKNYKSILKKRLFIQKNRVVKDKQILNQFTGNIPEYALYHPMAIKVIGIIFSSYFKFIKKLL